MHLVRKIALVIAIIGCINWLTIGLFDFTVPSDVEYVVFRIATYNNDNSVQVTINGKTYDVNTASNNGQYTSVTVDTSTTKTISFSTVVKAKRVMIDSISYHASVKSGGNGGDEDSSVDSGSQGGDVGGSEGGEDSSIDSSIDSSSQGGNQGGNEGNEDSSSDSSVETACKHSFGSWVVEKPASETEKGLQFLQALFYIRGE